MQVFDTKSANFLHFYGNPICQKTFIRFVIVQNNSALYLFFFPCITPTFNQIGYFGCPLLVVVFASYCHVHDGREMVA